MIEDEVLEFAQKAAAIYCRRYNARSQYDDAVGEATLYLWANRDLLKTISRGELMRRVIFCLIDKYRAANKQIRNGKTVIRSERILDGLADEKARLEAIDEREEARRLVAQAAVNAGVTDCLSLLLAVADGTTLVKASEAFNVPLRSASRIYSRFKFELQKLGKARGLIIREADDQDEAPLFKLANLQEADYGNEVAEDPAKNQRR